jgi:chromosomal replication initiator protein
MNIIWDEFLKIMREEAGSQVVETWFRAVRPKNWNRTTSTVSLEVPNPFICRWIKDHYLTLMKTHLGRLLHSPRVNIDFETLKEDGPLSKSPMPTTSPETEASNSALLVRRRHSLIPSTRTSLVVDQTKNRVKSSKVNEEYTFDSFIVGPSNTLAHAAALAVATNMGGGYNPLLIYGGTGLGKTHLLHCIGNEVLKRFPDKRVRYETSDRFMNEFINSIRCEKMQSFRQKYEKLDILLLDDVQFFSKKEQTQETFFHIFNALFEQKKHIVMTCDTQPKLISGLQERIKSRLNWGLTVDVQIPDLETKIAILQNKSDALNIKISRAAINHIASAVVSNVRELEGTLTRLGALASLTNQEVTLELAQQVTSNIQESRREGVLLHDVLKAVSKYFNISTSELKAKKRSKEIATARQIAFYLMKKLTFSPLQAIGEYLGKRNHSTVVHAVAKIEKMLAKDNHLAGKIRAIEHEIATRTTV